MTAGADRNAARDCRQALARANEALKSKEVLELMEKQGVEALGGTPAEFAKFIDHELRKWQGVVKAADIKP